MNIQKQLIGIVLVLLLTMSVVACVRDYTVNTIIEICDAVNIEKNTPYSYLKESTFVTEGRAYSLRDKAVYKNGEIDQLTVYRSDGVLTYQKAELLRDTALLNKINLPIKQKWYNKDNLLIKGPADKIVVSRINENICAVTNGKVTRFFTSKLD